MIKYLWPTLIIFLCLLIFPFILTDYGVLLTTEILILSIFALSLGLIMGYVGLISLGHAAFFGIGAYSVAMLSVYVSNTYLLISSSLLITTVVALLTGAVFIRTSNFYFLMITLAFSQMIYALVFQSPWFGGSNGLVVSVDIDFGFGAVVSPLGFYATIGAFFIFVYLFLSYFVNSPVGKTTKGIMDNESRMVSLGYNTWVYKLLAYTISGGLAGLAGGLYSFFNLFVSPDITNWMFSGQALIMVIIGGVGTLIGPAIGSGIFVLLQHTISSYTERWVLILGIILVLLVVIGRGGVINWLYAIKSKIWNKKKNTHHLNKQSTKEEKR